jgi:hypothetical protein
MKQKISDSHSSINSVDEWDEEKSSEFVISCTDNQNYRMKHGRDL